MNNTSLDRPGIDQSIITSAVNLLRSGELVAFPTETVYGLGADATNESALQKLYTTKGRPTNHPVIVHLASAEQMHDWAMDLSEYAKTLAKYFWPGPLTLIVKKSQHVSPLATGGQDTVGLRVPAHPVALTLLEAFTGGIAAPSANRYGRISSTCAAHVREEFGDQIRLVIDGGICPVGIESTIVDTTGSAPKILRPGMISEKKIMECLGLQAQIQSGSSVEATDSGKTIRVSGSDKTHYAPRTPMYLMDKQSIQSMLVKSNGKESYAVLAFSKPNSTTKLFIQASMDPKLYAHDLYNNLHQLDTCAADKILVGAVPETVEWEAISDRLKRAAFKP